MAGKKTEGDTVTCPLSRACQVTLKWEEDVPFRLIEASHLSRPEHYFSIYQSGCNLIIPRSLLQGGSFIFNLNSLCTAYHYTSRFAPAQVTMIHFIPPMKEGHKRACVT